MAIFHLSVKTVSRATGRSAVAAAAYRTATAIEDERLGQQHDYTRKRGVETAFIVAPDAAAWTADRSALWNAVEAAEKRRDAKVAREYELALPHELDRGGRERLVRAFAGEVVARFGVAADVAIHAPGREGDQRNHHAHVLTTTRTVTAEGMGAKTRELDVKQTSGPAIEALRELWAVQVNHALERIQAEARIDHRSLERQGQPDQAPTQHMGPGATALERQAARQALPEPASSVEREQPDPAVERIQQAEPVTRIGQHNAEVRERNRLLEAARKVMEAAWERAGELERVARAGVRKVMGLARGLGASIAAEQERQRVEKARQAAELQERQRIEALRIELARQQQARQAIATQQQRDAARSQAKAQEQKASNEQQRQANHSRPSRGPSMGM